ncbi:glucose-methanol-choline oxidoreductase [Aspergillus similis]
MGSDVSLEGDYIIVGGGTAGLVLASRLGGEPDTSIVVLEAGNHVAQDPRITVPATWKTLMGSDADWRLRSTPQAHLNNRVIKMPQGRLLGGSSGINGLAFIAPLKANINAWEALGGKGWNWENLHPYYKRSYTLQVPDAETKKHIGAEWLDPDVNGDSGPLKVSFPATLDSPLAKAWIDTFKTLDLVARKDPFSGEVTGAYSNLATVDAEAKTRSYSANAYGGPVARQDMQFVTDALVTRVLFEPAAEGSEVVATGVEVLFRGEVLTINARKEVILCAGAFNTPKILELSGIGNQELLTDLGIPNLQDHLSTSISFETVDGVETMDDLLRGDADAIQRAMDEYIEHRTGPMTIGGIQSSAVLPILDLHDPASKTYMPALMDRYLGPSGPGDDRHETIRTILARPSAPSCMMFLVPVQANLHDLRKSLISDTFQSGSFISLCLQMTLPFSRGNAHITSADPSAKQSINPNYLSHPLDIEIMARNLLDLQELHKIAPLSRYIKYNGRRNHPDAFLTGLESARKYLRDTAKTSYHYCGTCAMMPREKGGVVDERLKVYGTKNLRVCDASVFPLITAGDIQSSVYAVAERGADIIRGVI